VPRSVAKRPAKANPVHAGSLAFPPHPVKARFSSAAQLPLRRPSPPGYARRQVGR
jgi:hypothetical protein